MRSPILLSLFMALHIGMASPVDDLASPEQAVRDRAAAEIRRTAAQNPTTESSIKAILANPPEGYTGQWITYFTNGRKSNVVNYQNGNFSGDFLSYHSDGTLAAVQHYDLSSDTATSTGYHRSGQMQHHGNLKDGKPIGTWTWYGEQGKVERMETFHEAP